MNICLPSRYEDLNAAYRGRLIPNHDLINLINIASKSMKITGGIRFLPIFGVSGSGKSSASRELTTHMPDVSCTVLSREEIESKTILKTKILKLYSTNPQKLLIFIIDQYEENVIGQEQIPTQFVEHLSLLDRDRSIPSCIFLWLTTNEEFRQLLVNATSRNKRILLKNDFNILGPTKEKWPTIIEETFSFHNSDVSLSDYGIIEKDIINISQDCETIGDCIQRVADAIGEKLASLQDISKYQVVLIWPVCDGLRNQRVMQFSKPKDGYKLNWDSWYTELNEDERQGLPLQAFNRTRLYFDFRIIPIRVADLHRLCLNLNDDNVTFGQTYLSRFKSTHFFHIISDNWENYSYNPARERASQRADEASLWYEGTTSTPTLLSKRISKILIECGLNNSSYEKDIKTEYSKVRADIYVETASANKPKKIIELKAYSSENTMPSTIKEQIRVTLRRHAQLAGFLEKQ